MPPATGKCLDSQLVYSSCSLSAGDVKRRRYRQWPETGTTTADSSSAEDEKAEDSVATLSSCSESDSESRTFSSEDAASLGSTDTTSVWSARGSLSRLQRCLGILAGMAGGEIVCVGDRKVVNGVLCSTLNLCFVLCSLAISVILLPLALFDVFRCQMFWAQSLIQAYAGYQRSVASRRRSLYATEIRGKEELFDCDSARWRRQAWRCANALNDGAFTIFFTLLHLLTHRTLRGRSAQLALFRKYLARHPPAFPVLSNDEVFRFDKPGARFNLSMLFVIDRLQFEDICDSFQERWIEWEPKMTATICKQWGRYCFRPSADFNLQDHIKEQSINLEQDSIANVISAFGSEEFDYGKPLWQVLVLQPFASNSGVQRTAEFEDANFLPANRRPEELTYIMAKWSHVYADGVGTMTTIVQRLGDHGVDCSGLPEQYRREVPPWQVVLYWLWNGILAAMQGLRLFLFMSYGLAPYPALIQTGRTLKLPETRTGRKCYSTAAVFQLDEINQLREEIFERVGVRPTVNDVFAHCVAASAGRLRCVSEIEAYLRQYLKLPRYTVTPASQLSFRKRNSNPLRHNCLQSIIPMMCRTSVPTHMDNFTSLVCSRLPLPEHCWTAQRVAECGIVQELLRVKREIDFLKSQRLRTTNFLVMTFLFKSLPLHWAQTLYECAYRCMQLCSTNVAAPGINSKFFGKQVHGLYFWPAVPATGTLGTSLVSLGNRLQFLTIMEECELQPAVVLAERIYTCEGLPFGETERKSVLEVLSECWRRMVSEEYTKLKSLLLHPDRHMQSTEPL
eukprot:Gregarina_sp_Poly_1__1303@NODE_131_length_13241_cov_228_075983_g117_i0_p3_GENE_NODE_131_length_13241_cov_228_075983_g117_i0NODE_131_length_13241_cov_228_075983_g117_i0_p3_ORF_typecomplete_len791_score79_60WES_acyltransf/PF03007_16/2_5e03WES_acyltransf/PF03007_16/2e12DUF1298/PF06974_13/1_7e11AATase/PF07247_12/0_32AATase/PF07247_12/1_4e03Cpta_toxin/PF07254_12/22_NODE_131_length_13241_cov_228_075983_g117_i042786650